MITNSENDAQILIDGSESDISQIPTSEGHFIRDQASRKSISEKRPLGSHNDPSHFQTYQRIKHSRQTSGNFILIIFLQKSLL